MKESASIICILASIIFLSPSCIKTEEVDTIVHNAIIFSLNQENMIFESMAISDGKIIEIGKENQILNKYKSKIKIDLKKKFLYPGFIDAH